MTSNDKDMVFIIFTTDGLEQAKADVLAEKAALWLNPDLYDSDLLADFHAAEIEIHALPEQVNPDKEKAVLAALAHVEKQAPKTEILIEYI